MKQVPKKRTGIKTKKEAEKPLYHDLDHLWGVWTKEEAASFMKNLEIQRRIDEDQWKKTR